MLADLIIAISCAMRNVGSQCHPHGLKDVPVVAVNRPDPGQHLRTKKGHTLLYMRQAGDREMLTKGEVMEANTCAHILNRCSED